MAILLQDTFTRTNSTSLGTANTGQTWQLLPLLPAGSVFGTNGSVANIYTTRGGTDAAVINAGASDCIVDVDIVSRISQTRLFFRATSYDEAFMIDITSTSVAVWRWSAISGDANIGETNAFNSSTVSHVKIELQGSSIKIYFNNSSTAALSLTSTHNQTVTWHGIGGYNSANIQFDNFTVSDFNTGGTNATVTGVVAVETADALAPVVTAQRQATVSSIIANITADTLAPTISTQSSVSASVGVIAATLTADTVTPTLMTDSNVISPFGLVSADTPSPTVSLSGSISVITVIADAPADALNPTLSTGTNVLGTIGTSTADALSPNVGSITNITINAVIVNASADGISPSVSADRSISLAAPFADATADALSPMVGLSSSVQIMAMVTSVAADGLSPSISTTQGTRIDSAVAELAIDAISPVIQTDSIISAFIADVISTGLAPIINKDAIPEYREVIQIVLNITRQQNGDLDIRRKQLAPLDITQRMQSELKL